MTALGISDPRTWAAKDWVSDIVPHLAYGMVTAATLNRLELTHPTGILALLRTRLTNRTSRPA
jgi:hypothetical protein